MPLKRTIDVRIAELEEKLTRLKLEKEIAALQDQMRDIRPRRPAARKRQASKRVVQPELIPAVKKTTAAKKKAGRVG